MTTSFIYATANLQGTDSMATISKTAAAVVKATGADIIGWQEAPTGRVMDVLDTLGSAWGHSLCYEVPISYRKDLWERVEVARTKVNDGVKDVTPSRWVHKITLKRRDTGEIVDVINTHVVHHIEVSGLPRSYTGRDAIKFAGQLDRAKRHFALLRSEILESGTTPVVWGGDLNVDYYADKKKCDAGKGCAWFPYTMLGAVSKLLPAIGGTEGSRMIDWLGYAGTLFPSPVRKYPNGNSDHHPVAATFTLPSTRTPNRGLHVEAAIEHLKLVTRKDALDEVAAALKILESIQPA